MYVFIYFKILKQEWCKRTN